MMKTKQQILDLRDEMVNSALRSDEFKYVYDHLVLSVRSLVEEKLKSLSEDDLEGEVNEGLHVEQHDNFNSSASCEIELDRVKEIIDGLAANLDLVAAIYESE